MNKMKVTRCNCSLNKTWMLLINFPSPRFNSCQEQVHVIFMTNTGGGSDCVNFGFFFHSYVLSSRFVFICLVSLSIFLIHVYFCLHPKESAQFFVIFK